ncbi:MAG: hypothetical protein CM1200mP16_16350 [Nitrospina sp.]|nr:MAG: hypothetical protein CM1200mP16_16350 [Nitrospina sp.]
MRVWVFLRLESTEHGPGTDGKDRGKTEPSLQFANFNCFPPAGQPVSEDGKTCYKLEPEDMADYVEHFVKDFGVSVIGGCCGTTPEHILFPI